MKICWFSDMDLSGSGYLNLTIPLCSGLSAKGHDLKISGLGYRGNQHNYNFSIIPAGNIQEGLGIIQNLYNLWGFDVLVVALDIPLQLRMIQQMKGGRPFKYVGIMPVEAGPICLTWSMGLMLMDKIFIISEFGKKECELQGISAEHLQVGIDTNSWRVPTAEEKQLIRKNVLGIGEDGFIILTVADNQERKNLSAGLDIVAKFIKNGHPNVRYMIVTREFNGVGWMLRDLAQEFGISDKVMIFERGMEFKKLWSLYAASDLFFLPSKAEGLGMPLLEAMAVGIPCIGTNCTGIAELLGHDGSLTEGSIARGVAVDYVHTYPDCSYRDPFGNGRRYIISPEDGVKCLEWAYVTHTLTNEESKETISEYVKTRKWDIAVDQLEKALLQLNEQKESQQAIQAAVQS